MKSLDWLCFHCVELLDAAVGFYNSDVGAIPFRSLAKAEREEFTRLIEVLYEERQARCRSDSDFLKCWQLFGDVHPDVITDQLGISWHDWAWRLDYKEVLKTIGER